MPVSGKPTADEKSVERVERAVDFAMNERPTMADALASAASEGFGSVKPLRDRVVVRPIEAESKTASGIYLPEACKDELHKSVKGTVLSVGPGKRLSDGSLSHPDVKAGDTVVYGKYAGTEVEIRGVKHLILTESELLGIIEG